MTKETKIAIGIGSALALGFLAVKVFSNKRSSIVSDAKKEYKHWGEGAIKEGDERTMQRLRDYWKSAGVGGWSDSKMIKEAWSAAFISYIMEKNNVKGFKGATSHSTYIQQAKKNNKGIKAYRPEDAKIEKGDVVCFARSGSGANYDTTGNYTSHCDIVVGVKKSHATLIGGNVNNNVDYQSRGINLNSEGKIDLETTTRPYIAVLKV